MTDAKILVIDDNTAVLSTLKIVLKCVFKTVVAVSGCGPAGYELRVR